MPHICHLTLLNPALHSRIFYKEATTQYHEGFVVTVIGQGSESLPASKYGINLIPTGEFQRLGLRRFTLRHRIYKKALAVNADIYQVHTPELLGVAMNLRRKLPRCKIVYDMHEDYAANILHAGYYSPTTSRILSTAVRKAENDFALHGDGVIYAETCYEKLLRLDPDRHITILNKYKPPLTVTPPAVELPVPYLLHTGTLAENWGVYNAIEFWLAIRRFWDVGLVMAGHGQDGTLISEILSRVKKSGAEHRFRLIGGTQYLPYEAMPPLIAGCLAGLAFYNVKDNIRERIPTKFFEFMAHRKPLLFTHHEPWNAMNAAHDFGKAVSFPLEMDQTITTVRELQEAGANFYRKPLPDDVWSWETEGPRLMDWLMGLTRK